VQFVIDGISVGLVSLNSAGIATLSTSTLEIGTHNVLALYLGDDTFSASEAVLAQTVIKADTVTTLVVSSGPFQTYTFTWTLTVPSPPVGQVYHPTGNIILQDGGIAVPNRSDPVSGTGQFDVPPFPRGSSHSMTAMYTG